jgi:hypothetical protein
MGKLNIEQITNFVEGNIGTFHERRSQFLENAKLEKILCRKNPYLFKAKNILTAGDLVKGILDAYLSSQEEAMFGDFLEGLAIFICGQVYAGRKSAAEGIDLEFEKDGIKYIVAIKSGPNWGNSSQIRKMKENFRKAIQTLRSSGAKARIEAINGCCYGRIKKAEQLNLYLDIIKPLGFKAKEKNERFNVSYSNLINNFTQEFIKTYCLEDGSINWDLIVKINSAYDKPLAPRKKKIKSK